MSIKTPGKWKMTAYGNHIFPHRRAARNISSRYISKFGDNPNFVRNISYICHQYFVKLLLIIRAIYFFELNILKKVDSQINYSIC